VLSKKIIDGSLALESLTIQQDLYLYQETMPFPDFSAQVWKTVYKKAMESSSRIAVCFEKPFSRSRFYRSLSPELTKAVEKPFSWIIFYLTDTLKSNDL
jgi:hypothetical protein